MRLTQDQLSESLNVAKQQVTIGSKYQHYKSADMTYVVKAIAIQEVDNEPCVIYQALYGNQITYSRPVKVWIETIEFEGKPVSRFTRI